MAKAAAHVRYPNTYTWLIFVAALDAMLTYIVLHQGGREANALAAMIFAALGWHGMLLYKFALTLLVIVLCEIIGRRDDRWGRRLGSIGVGLTCLPILLAFVLLATRLSRY